jgi:hypothetical protein
MSSPTIHATLGASKAERWMSCPGSIRLEAGLPDVTSEYAREGTAAHALGERAIQHNVDPLIYLDTEIEGVTVTEEMVDAVRIYVAHVRERAAELDAAPLLEQKFDLTPLNPPGPMFGTSDCTISNGDHLEVIDYKHGRGVAVGAVENAQLMYYALGAVVLLRVRPRTIRVTIVQPRASHPAGIIRSFEFDFDRLVEFKRELFAAAARTTEPDAPLHAGSHCKFCKALAICPAQRDKAAAVAQTEFHAAAAPPSPDTLTLDELHVVLAYADTLEGWLDAVRHHVKGRLEAGEQVPGWKLVPKRATRKWADESEAERVLGDLLGEEAYAPRKLVSPAQAEKALKVTGSNLPQRLVTAVSSGNNLAPDHDPRPAALPSAQTEFDVLAPAPTPEPTPAPKTARTRGNARKQSNA